MQTSRLQIPVRHVAKRYGIYRKPLRVGVALMVLAIPLGAQTLFQWPSVSVDVSTYTTVEECIAATNRTQRYVEGLETTDRDTLPFDPKEAFAPLPAPVVQIARRCAERFHAQDAPLATWRQFMDLYLRAGLDSAAVTVAARRLEHNADIPEVRIAVLDTILQFYDRAQPVRVQLTAPLVPQLIRLLQDSSQKNVRVETRIRMYERLMGAFSRIHDTAQTRRYAEELVKVGINLTDAERAEGWFFFGKFSILNALNYLSHDAALDSLRRGTGGYVALKRTNWALATGERHADAFPYPNGKIAPRIEGDFWFPKAPDVPRPTPGELALVVFFDGRCRSGRECLDYYAVLKRLSQRFPDVQVTLAGHTQGWFGPVAPPPPADEAAIMWRLYHEFHKLPGHLAVGTTPFFRLPEPDRRRINGVDTITAGYAFGSPGGLGSGSAFLVDRDGVIVERVGLGRGSEKDVIELLDILVRRRSR